MGSTFQTKRQALVEFAMPEFTDKKKITTLVHVDERTESNCSQYDMIIRMDLMTELGIVIDIGNKLVKWGEVEIELKPRGLLSKTDMINEVYQADTVLECNLECQGKTR